MRAARRRTDCWIWRRGGAASSGMADRAAGAAPAKPREGTAGRHAMNCIVCEWPDGAGPDPARPVPSVPGPGGGSQTSRAPCGAEAPRGTERSWRGECLAKGLGTCPALNPAAHTGRAGPLHDAWGQKSEGEAGLAGSRSGWGI